MHKKLRIESGLQTGAEMRFLLTKTPKSPGGTPTGTMITDSDEITFVYLLEEEEGYSHIHFPQKIWPLMVDVLQTDSDPILSWGEEMITLKGFKDELMMLIFNIEGNNNYGEKFTSVVEKAFEKILKSTE